MYKARILSLALCLAMLLSLAPLAVAEPSVTTPGELPVTSEPVKLTIGIRANASVTDFNDNVYTDLLREKSGVDIEVIPFDYNEYKTQFQLMATSGERLPDILIGFSFTPMERESYGRQGYVIPLNDYFDEDTGLTYFYKEGQKFLTDAEKDITLSAGLSSDGNLYSFPFWAVSLADLWSCGLIINNTFLDALGMEMPTTTDELYDYLVAVRDGDPNGNGKNDEIPYIGHTEWTGEVFLPIINAFTFYPSREAVDRLCVDDAGNLYLPYTVEEFREGMKYLNNLYSEGLLSDLSFSQDRLGLRAMTDLAEEDDDVVALAASHRSYMFASHNSAPKRMDYTTMGPLVGPNGVSYSATYQPEPAYVNFITADCEYPEIAFRVLDLMIDTEMTLNARYGIEDKHWRWATEEEIERGSAWQDLGFGDPLYRSLPEIVWGEQNNVIWNTTSNTWQPVIFTCLTGRDDPDDPNVPDIQRYNGRDWNNGVMQRYGHAPAKLVGSLAYSEEEVEQLGTIAADMKTYVDESITRFILGELSLENDWDSFIKTLDSMGMGTFLELSQAAYDRAYK